MSPRIVLKVFTLIFNKKSESSPEGNPTFYELLTCQKRVRSVWKVSFVSGEHTGQKRLVVSIIFLQELT